MEKIEQRRLTGERALFMSNDLEVVNCIFADGESPLKESKNITVADSMFEWKYPFWYCENVQVTNSIFGEMARAGIWYTNHIQMDEVTIEAPKEFRRCDDVRLNGVHFAHAEETLWNCRNVQMNKVSAKGDYFATSCENMEITDFSLAGNYSFDGCRNITMRRAKLLSKDAFWNCENVTVYDSIITGEYLGWNSKNITFINCTIESLQGMCYMENVVLKDCTLLNTDLAFEYSTVDADVKSSIVSVKNPVSGTIRAQSIGEIIFDDPKIDSAATNIVLE